MLSLVSQFTSGLLRVYLLQFLIIHTLCLLFKKLLQDTLRGQNQNRNKQKPTNLKKQQRSESDPDVAGMLESSDHVFKATVIYMLGI